VIFIISLIAWNLINNVKIENPVAEIYKDGALVSTFDLSKTGKYMFAIGTNDITIRDGSIRVDNSDCSAQSCINIGYIPNGRLPIICVPNRLEIRIVGGAESEFDAIVR
jgi:hypothetical protein